MIGTATAQRNRTARMLVVGVSGLVLAIVLTAFNLGIASAVTPTERDFFGTVIEMRGDTIIVSTESGVYDVPTTADTVFRIPLKPDATLADLSAGDFIAVSMNISDRLLAADIVFLIPGKTQLRHVPGEIVSLVGREITIQPIALDAGPITFFITDETVVRLHVVWRRWCRAAPSWSLPDATR